MAWLTFVTWFIITYAFIYPSGMVWSCYKNTLNDTVLKIISKHETNQNKLSAWILILCNFLLYKSFFFFLPLFKNARIPIRLHFPILAKLLLRLEKQMNLKIAVIRENFSIWGRVTIVSLVFSTGVLHQETTSYYYYN